MTPYDLEKFLDKYGLTDEEFARLLDVTTPAVKHWLKGIRKISPTVAKLVKIFDSKPEIMKEF